MGIISLGLLFAYIGAELMIKFIPEPLWIENPNCLMFFYICFFFFDINYSFQKLVYRRTAVFFTGLITIICIFFITRKFYDPKISIAQHNDFLLIYGVVLGYFWLLSPNEDSTFLQDKTDEENTEFFEEENEEDLLNAFESSEIPKAVYNFIKTFLMNNLIIMFFHYHIKMNNNYTMHLEKFDYKRFLSEATNDFSLFYTGYAIHHIMMIYLQKKNNQSLNKTNVLLKIITKFIAFSIIKLSFVLLINNEFNIFIQKIALKLCQRKYYLVLYNMFNISIQKKCRLIGSIIHYLI